ncbi:hypothetical protein Pstr01_18160 [Pseudomonas straminea]|nr:hypothetical protein Pstr01_18160 [Pseudomonas straminea]
MRAGPALRKWQLWLDVVKIGIKVVMVEPCVAVESAGGNEAALTGFLEWPAPMTLMAL